MKITVKTIKGELIPIEVESSNNVFLSLINLITLVDCRGQRKNTSFKRDWSKYSKTHC